MRRKKKEIEIGRVKSKEIRNNKRTRQINRERERRRE